MEAYNAKYVPELFIDIARALGGENPGEDAERATQLVLEGIRFRISDYLPI